MSLHLDASAVLPTLVVEAASGAADRLFRDNKAALLISDFAAADIGSALSRLVRMQILSPSEALSRLAFFDEWRAQLTSPAEVTASDLRMASLLVRRFELMLRAPDAVHLAVCRRTGDALVTFDRRLARAASALGVEAVVPA